MLVDRCDALGLRQSLMDLLTKSTTNEEPNISKAFGRITMEDVKVYIHYQSR